MTNIESKFESFGLPLLTTDCPHGGCSECVHMCRTSPCYGPPEEMEALMKAGYGARLSLRLTPDKMPALMPASKGQERSYYKDGECTFLTADGKCELHSIGLKPLIGRLVDCQDHSLLAHDFQQEIGFKIIAEWNSEYGYQAARRFALEFAKDVHGAFKQPIIPVKPEKEE